MARRTKLEQQMAEDSSTVPADDQLANIAKLITMRALWLKEKARFEELLSEANKELQHIEQTLLPDALGLAGVAEFTATDGTRIELRTRYSGGARTPEALTWLRDNGHEGIIKNEVTAQFGKEDDNEATALTEYLEEHGASYEAKQAVHPSTFRAWLREQTEAGHTVPLDLFNANVHTYAHVKEGK